jgi:uncharacterized protein (TIGR03118 family)
MRIRIVFTYTCSRRNTVKNLCLLGVVSLVLTSSAEAIDFSVTKLVTSDSTANPAMTTDTTLKNGCGIALTASSPFWVSANGSGFAEVYKVDHSAGTVAKMSVQVTIPGDGTVTGQVSNSNSAAFNNDAFLFGSEDGTISGWRSALGTTGTAEVLVTGSTANVYKGVTLVTVSGNSYLYAANFRAGTVDVLKGNTGAPNLTGNFLDPTIPAGYAPFNVQDLGGTLYVTYALQDFAKHDDMPGPGQGYVDAFDTQRNFLGRIASQGTLNSPWGLALALASFGSFAGDLLVGNFGDGAINAYSLTSTPAFAGQVDGTNGQPLAIDGLWGLAVGNGGNGGKTSTLYFAAGPNNESQGLFGAIAPVPEPSAIALLGAGAAVLGGIWRRQAARRAAA